MQITRIFLLAFASLFAGQSLAGPVNINTASQEQLALELDGVGPVIAQRIIEHRSTHGDFADATQLTQVKGVGEKLLRKNAEFIRVE